MAQTQKCGKAERNARLSTLDYRLVGLAVRSLAGFSFRISSTGSQVLDYGNERHEHGDDDESYANTEEYDKHRLDGGRKTLERRIHLLLIEVRDLGEHLVK